MPVLATIGNDSLRPYGYAAGSTLDPYFSYNRLLLSGIGTNGANNNTFTDSTGNNTVTRTGNVMQGSSSPFLSRPTSPYNSSIFGGSAGFDGTGDYLSVADSAALEPGSGDFCIEFWAYATTITGTSTLLTKRATSTGFGPYLIQRVGASIQVSLSSNGTSWDILNANTVGNAISANGWFRVALYRSGNNFYVAMNTSSTASLIVNSSSTLINNTSAIFIGGDSNTNYFSGNIGSLRITIGSSVYAGTNSPVPTTPYINQGSNTKLLLNFAAAGIYDGTQYNNFQSFAGATISTALYKWPVSSINFTQANTGYLQAIDSQPIGLGTGDFTIDFWIYIPTRLTSYVLDMNGNTNTNRFVIRTETNGGFTIRGNSLTIVYLTTSASYAVAAATWTHVAVIRSSGDLGVYVSGVRAVGATANTTDFSGVYNGGVAIGGTYSAGGTGGVGGFNLQDFRITPGIVRFSTSTTLGVQAFTPPNGPDPLIGA